jgi:uroporphyrinogen III methyltransferase/synthase
MSALAGKRILVTRPAAQAAGLIERLRAEGAELVAFPTIEIAPLAGTEAERLDRALAALNTYDWVIFTSVNGVEAFWQRVSELGHGAEGLGGVRVAAIGPATADGLRAHQIQPDLVPTEYRAEAILSGLGAVQGKRILLLRADIARKALFDELTASGALPEEISIYRTMTAEPPPEAFDRLANGIDVATFTSSSTVRAFFELCGPKAQGYLAGATIACIGPITAETAREYGLPVHITASEYTANGLVQALLEYFAD